MGKGAGLTLDLRDVGELLRVTAVAGLLPFQLQEDGDGTLNLCAVIGRRLEHDGVLGRQQTIGALQQIQRSMLTQNTNIQSNRSLKQQINETEVLVFTTAFYLFVNVCGREVAEGLPAALVLLVETDLDVVCGAQRHDGTFPGCHGAEGRTGPGVLPFWTLSQSRKISSPPRTVPHVLSMREIFRLEALGDSGGKPAAGK